MNATRFEHLPVGLVGCGRWGRFILRDLVQLGCETWVVEVSPESIAHATAHGAHRIVASIDELPAHLEGYVVAVPSSLHAVVVSDLLDRRRPIYVEKPLTIDRESARFLAEAAGERIFVMDKWRYHPAVEMLANLIGDGELGKVRTIRTRRVGWGNPHPDTDSVWILLPHDLSIVLHLLGSLPEARWAVSERTVDDAVCGLHGALGDNPAVLVEVSSSSPIQERSVRVVCDRGVAMMADPWADHILIQPGNGLETGAFAPVEKRPIVTEMPLLRELRAFLTHVRGGPPPSSSAAEGAAIVETIATLRALASR